MYQQISIKECLSEGWSLFKKYFGILIGTYLVYFLIILPLNYIPVINLITAFFIAPILIGGLTLFFLNIGKDSEVKLKNLFDGFNRYGSILGTYWVFVMFSTIILIPSIIYTVMAYQQYPRLGSELFSSLLAWKLILFWFANMIVMLVVLIRFIFVFFVMVDDPKMGVIENFNTSNQIVKGSEKDLLTFIFISIILQLIGYTLFIIPGIVLSFVTGIGFVRYYLKLKEMKLKPENVVTVE